MQVPVGLCKALCTAQLPSWRLGFSPCCSSCFTLTCFYAHPVLTPNSGASLASPSWSFKGEALGRDPPSPPPLSASVRAPAETRRMGREDANRGLQSSKTHKQTMLLQFSSKRSRPLQTEGRLCSPHNLPADLRGHRCVWFLLQIDLISSWPKGKKNIFHLYTKYRDTERNEDIPPPRFSFKI